MGPRVVHLTADFPDPVAPRKTAAIRRLVDLTQDRFDHYVVSLNRSAPQWPGYLRPAFGAPDLALDIARFEYGEAWTYRAPPAGIWHRTVLEALGDALAERIEQIGARPQLIVGHKLTIEGIAVARAARRLGVPYALSIQGNTDTRVIAARPDLRRTLARVFHEAAVVFPFAPWAIRRIEAALSARSRGTALLPCARENDVMLPPTLSGSGFVSAFHLEGWRTKNLDGLLAAHRLLGSAGRSIPLAIVGGGSERASQACRQLARRDPLVIFEGALDNAAMPRRLNAASAFVMPSRRESFGLVFIEALCAGLPVIYPAGQAIDGYFDGAPFAIRVDPRSPRSIAEAMAHAIDNEAALKRALANWQAGPGPARFSRVTIADTLAHGLAEAIASSAQ